MPLTGHPPEKRTRVAWAMALVMGIVLLGVSMYIELYGGALDNVAWNNFAHPSYQALSWGGGGFALVLLSVFLRFCDEMV